MQAELAPCSWPICIDILSNMQEVVRTHHWPWGTCQLPCCRQDTHEGSNDSGHHSRWLSQGNSNPIPGTCFPREMCSSKCSQQGMYASCHKSAKRLQPIKVSLEHLKLTVRSWSKPLCVVKNWSCKKHYTWPGRSQQNEEQWDLQINLTDNEEEYPPLQGVLGMVEWDQDLGDWDCPLLHKKAQCWCHINQSH